MSGFIASLFVVLCPTDQPVRVTVVVVLASTKDTGVDPKLADLAKEVQKREPTLIGFRLVSTEAKSIPIGQGDAFDLIDQQQLRVKVEKPKDANGRIGLTILPPGLERIKYGCACEKFFPVVTPYQTKNGEVLIVAVMAKPCTLGKKQSTGWFPWRD
jgi:hypothetical protein